MPGTVGMTYATDEFMATIFALILLPALFAVGALLLALSGGAAGLSTVAAAMTFIALAGGTFVGLYRLARRWEDEAVE